MPLIYLSGFLAFLKTAIFAFGYISNNSLFPEPLSEEEEMKYLKKYMKGDEDARNILIERNLRLVAHVCKKYNIPNVDNEDLISIGTIGLIKGINTFNTDKGVRLATYAARCIENEILMHLRSIKKLGAEVYLNEPIGKDKDDNEIALIDILENDEKNIEDEIDLKIKIKKVYEKMKDILKEREKVIIELRFGLRR
jgi:RNA polymerase sporulation-specific sigma factor